MKQAFRLSSLLLAFLCLAAATGSAQTATPTPAASPTPDPFVAQITASAANSFAGDISGNGRFVVFESTGDLATLQPGQTTRSPNNTDGNREIFLYDYAQRRVFQLTDTRSALVDPSRAEAERFRQENIAVEVSNNRPVLSRDGRWIVFSSNADTPFSFDGNANKAALQADGNQELFLYRVPDVADADLTSGATPASQDLRQNAFTRVTNTPASRVPSAGTTSAPPFFADDNREAIPNDDASRVVFVSTRNLPTVNAGADSNTDGSPDVFVYNRAGASFSRVTDTRITQQTPLVFTDNPSISGATAASGAASTITFISNGNLPDVGQTAGANADGNAEVYVASFNGTTVTSLRQVTRTRRTNQADAVNFLNFGRRVSRSGAFVAFESVAQDPRADNTATNQATRGMFVYNVLTDTLIPFGPRAASTNGDDDVLRFPTFTGDNSQVVFTSALNLRPDFTRADANDNTGLNPASPRRQVFTAPVPPSAGAALTLRRLTNVQINAGAATMQPFASDTVRRIAFSFAGELGGGNADSSHEVFYLNTPPAPGAGDTANAALGYFTGATRREAAVPTPSPSPSPAATPVAGLAPGMVAYVTAGSSGVTFSAATVNVCPAPGGCDAASESQRRPSLPVELGGVSLSINNAAAGLYFVGPNEIQFVVPQGLPTTGTGTVVINVNQGGSVRTIRSAVQLAAAQPDVYSSTNGPGGRASVTNVTNPLLAVGTSEPFTVTTTYVNSQGQSVTEPTLLRVMLTGVRGVARGAITVRLVRSDGTNTDVTGDAIPRDPQATDAPGIFTLDFRLPASLAGAGDVSIVVLVNTGGQTFSSRPAETAPRFRIS